jgi:hypothetical protein
MTTEAAGGNSAEDREVIRLAKARLVRVCRLDASTAEQALSRAAAEQRAALVAVAMRVLAASPQDLAAGRVLWTGRHGEVMRAGQHREPRRPNRPMRQKQPRRPPRGQRGQQRKGRK